MRFLAAFAACGLFSWLLSAAGVTGDAAFPLAVAAAIGLVLASEPDRSQPVAHILVYAAFVGARRPSIDARRRHPSDGGRHN